MVQAAAYSSQMLSMQARVVKLNQELEALQKGWPQARKIRIEAIEKELADIADDMKTRKKAEEQRRAEEQMRAEEQRKAEEHTKMAAAKEADEANALVRLPVNAPRNRPEAEEDEHPRNRPEAEEDEHHDSLDLAGVVAAAKEASAKPPPTTPQSPPFLPSPSHKLSVEESSLHLQAPAVEAARSQMNSTQARVVKLNQELETLQKGWPQARKIRIEAIEKELADIADDMKTRKKAEEQRRAEEQMRAEEQRKAEEHTKMAAAKEADEANALVRLPVNAPRNRPEAEEDEHHDSLDLAGMVAAAKEASAKPPPTTPQSPPFSSSSPQKKKRLSVEEKKDRVEAIEKELADIADDMKNKKSDYVKSNPPLTQANEDEYRHQMLELHSRVKKLNRELDVLSGNDVATDDEDAPAPAPAPAIRPSSAAKKFSVKDKLKELFSFGKKKVGSDGKKGVHEGDENTTSESQPRYELPDRFIPHAKSTLICRERDVRIELLQSLIVEHAQFGMNLSIGLAGLYGMTCGVATEEARYAWLQEAIVVEREAVAHIDVCKVLIVRMREHSDYLDGIIEQGKMFLMRAQTIASSPKVRGSIVDQVCGILPHTPTRQLDVPNLHSLLMLLKSWESNKKGFIIKKDSGFNSPVEMIELAESMLDQVLLRRGRDKVKSLENLLRLSSDIFNRREQKEGKASSEALLMSEVQVLDSALENLHDEQLHLESYLDRALESQWQYRDILVARLQENQKLQLELTRLLEKSSELGDYVVDIGSLMEILKHKQEQASCCDNAVNGLRTIITNVNYSRSCANVELSVLATISAALQGMGFNNLGQVQNVTSSHNNKT